MEVSEETLRRIQGQYVEIRHLSTIYHTLKTQSGYKVEEICKEGISVRVVDKGRCKFVFSETPDAIEDRVHSTPWAPISAYTPADPTQHYEDQPQPIDLPIENAKNILETFKDFGSMEARLESLAVYEHVMTNMGTDVYHGSSKLFLRFFFTPVEGFTIVYSCGYPGDDIIQKLEHIEEREGRIVEFHSIPSGTYDVVLSSQVTGMLFHEVAHSFEGSIPKTHAFSPISIVDNPRAERLGGYTYDSEGCRASQTLLIEKGAIRGCLASVFDPGTVHPTGNGRASSYDVQPQPRQSNLEVHVCAEQYTEEELLEAVDHGVYIAQVGEGSIFPGGIVNFMNTCSYLVRNGERAEPLRNVNFGGVLLDMINSIEHTGDDSKVEPSACWKNHQRLLVTTKAPSSLIREVPLVCYNSSKSSKRIM